MADFDYKSHWERELQKSMRFRSTEEAIVKTLERIRGVLASSALRRDFGETMENYFVRNPEEKRKDEQLTTFVTELETRLLTLRKESKFKRI